jgi:hypothetical protein
MYAIEMVSCDRIHIPSFMKIGPGVEAILLFIFRKLSACNVGIRDG